jgi:hypothetical protein
MRFQTRTSLIKTKARVRRDFQENSLKLYSRWRYPRDPSTCARSGFAGFARRSGRQGRKHFRGTFTAAEQFPHLHACDHRRVVLYPLRSGSGWHMAGGRRRFGKWRKYAVLFRVYLLNKESAESKGKAKGPSGLLRPHPRNSGAVGDPGLAG